VFGADDVSGGALVSSGGALVASGLAEADDEAEAEADGDADDTRSVLEDVKRHCKLKGLRRLARRAGIDPANLNGVLKGRRKPSRMMLTKLESTLWQDS
jgi:hypothetical protein